MDLNIIYDHFGKKDENIGEKIKKAFELGYVTVAVNTLIDSTQLSEKNVKIPEPAEVSTFLDMPSFKNKHLRVLSRLTAVIGDGIHGHHLMQCPVTKKYDLIAVRPVGEKMLQHVCANLDVDIISVDLGEKLPFSFKRTYLGQAREKSMVFEIEYAPCLRDQTVRRWIISNAQNLADVSKYQNIIVSSGALNVLELRGVSDVVNMCHLFGFNETQARIAVKTSSSQVLHHSATRRKTGCGFVSIEEISKFDPKNRWLVEVCRIPTTTDSGPKNSNLITKSKNETGLPPFKKRKDKA